MDFSFSAFFSSLSTLVPPLSLTPCPLGGKGRRKRRNRHKPTNPRRRRRRLFLGWSREIRQCVSKIGPCENQERSPQRRMSAQTSSDDDTGPLFPPAPSPPPLRTGRLRAPPPPPFLSLQLAKPLSSSSSSPHPSSTHQSSTHFCPPGFFPLPSPRGRDSPAR